MTIRQIGGVFGRHPNFQDVETDDLQVNQSVNFSSASQVDLGTSTSKIAVSINSAADQFYMERSGTGETWSLQHNGGLVTHQINTSTGIRWMKDGGEMARLRFGNLSVGTTDITHRLNIGGDIGLTGNVIVANGKGIDFSATAGTGTSELFDDYEEGTWTPSLAFGTDVVLASATGTYTKMGRLVYVTFNIDVTSHTQPDTSPISINGLPYNIAADIGTLFSIDPLASTFVDLTTTPLGGIKTSANTFLQLYQTDRSAITYTEAAASGKLVGAAMYEAS